MSLPIIRSKGIQAYCADLIVDPNAIAYLLSVAGYQVAVKGIIANVLEYGPANLYGAGGLRLELTRDTTAYHVRYHRLPSGLYQAVLLPKMAYAECREPADQLHGSVSVRGAGAVLRAASIPDRHPAASELGRLAVAPHGIARGDCPARNGHRRIPGISRDNRPGPAARRHCR